MTAEQIAFLFAEYQTAMRTLAASCRTVAERKAAIAIRDEFEGGIEGHIGTLLEVLTAQPVVLDALTKLANEATGFLSMADPHTHGYTNITVLRERIAEARDVIARATGEQLAQARGEAC